MEQVTQAIILLIILFALLGSGVWVSLSLMLVGVAGVVLFKPDQIPFLGAQLADNIWGISRGWELAALPLFIWMGEILFRSKLAENMFNGLAPWMRNVPGRLLHVNIIGCAIFAAVSGSSAATAATIGKITVPELKKRGYPTSMSLGTLSGSATLGLLIPPSIIMIVYGVATDTSIARLFIAGVIPGLMLVGLFFGYTMLWSLLNKDKFPDANDTFSYWGHFKATQPSGLVKIVRAGLIVSLALATFGVIGWNFTTYTSASKYAVLVGSIIYISLFTLINKERVKASGQLIPVVLLIVGVLGSIYTGVASATDAAAVGVLLALLFTWLSGSLSRKMFVESLLGATTTSCMIAFILAGAAFLTFSMGLTGLPGHLASWIDSLQLTQLQLIMVLTVFFIILGCFLDGISAVVLTTSVIMPMVLKAGIDPVWFGIYIVLVVEMAQITPPVGFNLFVIQALTGENLFKLGLMSLPFFLLLLFAVFLIVMFPQIVLFLPSLMFAG